MGNRNIKSNYSKYRGWRKEEVKDRISYNTKAKVEGIYSKGGRTWRRKCRRKGNMNGGRKINKWNRK